MYTPFDRDSFLRSIDLRLLVQGDGVVLRGNSAGEQRGPCPKCGGGDDRFHVKEHEGIGYWFCRKCHYEVDGRMWHSAIDYVMWLRDVDFKDALSILGGETVASGEPRSATVKRDPPPEMIERPTDEWRHVALGIVAQCETILWNNSKVSNTQLDYLRNERGLSDDTIRRLRFGYNPTQRYIDNKVLEIGVTIPTIVFGAIWSINVGRPKGIDPKYEKYAGSKAGLFNADSVKGAKVIVVLEGEFDAALCSQYAGKGLACVTLGAANNKPLIQWRVMMSKADRVLVCLDNDKAGDEGAKHWEGVKHTERVRVPLPHKDPTEFWQKGGDLGAWLYRLTGIPRWQPPKSPESRKKFADAMLQQFEETEDPKLLARANVCLGIEISSDNEKWLELAQ